MKTVEQKRKERRERYLKNYDREKQKNKEYREKNRELIRAKQKKYNRENPEKRKNAILKNVYGITLEQYNQIFEKQKGKCAICKRHQKELTRTLCVDHNHKTKQVRGLLCVTCNTDVSVVENRLKEMLRYLNKYRKDVN